MGSSGKRPAAHATTEWWDDKDPWELSGDRLVCFVCGGDTRADRDEDYTEMLVSFSQDWGKRQVLGVHVSCLRRTVKAPVRLWMDR